MMNLLNKFDAMAAVEAELSRDGADPTQVVIESIISPTEAMIEGRRTILAGTNNYLGLTLDADCIKAGQDALEQQGTGTTGSRMANGTYAAHLALESELADFYGMPHAMVFSTGYAANLGTLCALLGPGDAVLRDPQCANEPGVAGYFASPLVQCGVPIILITSKLGFHRLQLGLQTLTDGLAQHREAPVPLRRTDVREAEEVERLRFTRAASASTSGRTARIAINDCSE